MTRQPFKIEAPELRLDPERIIESLNWTEVGLDSR